MNNTSILDKVITRKQAEEMTKFNPAEVLVSLFTVLSDREREVLSRRFGLKGNKKETLGKIGESLGVTRERVRQIEANSLKKIKSDEDFDSKVKNMENVIQQILEQHGGVMEEIAFLLELLILTGDTSTNRAIILFILNNLLSGRLQKLERLEKMLRGWKLRLASLELIEKTIETGLNIFQKENKTLTNEELLSKFKESDFYRANEDKLTDDAILSYLGISQKIKRNPFGQWGLIDWGTINLRRMSDKIYLVLKKHGQPLHFTKIAELINQAKFDDKISHSPTVHNELILDKKYVLVGRGIYALAEWGYKPGVVSEVIVEILREAEKPLSKTEITTRVLKCRRVNESTVYLALTNKEKFKKLPSGEYILKSVE